MIGPVLRRVLAAGLPRLRALSRLRALLPGLALAVIAIGPAVAQSRDRAGDFDFYVLALSWSPSYCEAEGDRRGDAQCARPFHFVVHGLWPQYERGFPADCRNEAGRLPERLIRDQLDIFPAFGLVIHQWRKHGTCSGLDPEGYFAAARKAFGKVRIPAEFTGPGEPRMVDVEAVERAFLAANPGLDRTEIGVTCDDRRLREVRLCFTRDLGDFRACPEVDGRACRRDRVYLPAVRGR